MVRQPDDPFAFTATTHYPPNPASDTTPPFKFSGFFYVLRLPTRARALFSDLGVILTDQDYSTELLVLIIIIY